METFAYLFTILLPIGFALFIIYVLGLAGGIPFSELWKNL